MSLTAAQKYALNHMNNVAAKVGLGDLIDSAAAGGVIDGGITAAKLASDAVTTVKILAKNVTPAKIALASASILVGAASGAAAEVSLSGDATIDNTGALTVAAKAISGPKIALTHNYILVGDSGGAGAGVAVSGDLTVADTGAFTIADSAVTNAKVAAGAAIAFSKLAALADGNILVGSGATVATSVAMSGDVTIINTGATTIANSAVTNAKVAAGAAIAFSKLAALTSGNVLVGSAGNVATSVAMSGDVTIDNTGATAIGTSKVLTAMINAAAVTVAKLDPAVMLEATGTLTLANLTGMNGTPVTLIAAPGVGKIIVLDEIELLHTYATAAYTAGGVIVIEYADGTDIVELPATVVTAGASHNFLVKPSVYAVDAATGTASGQDFSASTNQLVRITNLTGAFANGNASNILKYRIRYHVVTAIT